MRNCNLPLPTPKLGSFHHTLILSTSYPGTDMKEEILQGKARLIKFQKANPETIPMQNILCPLCHSRCNSRRLWVSVSCSHITRDAVLGYSGPKPQQCCRLPLTSKISPCFRLEISPNASRLQHGFVGAGSHRNLAPSKDSCARSWSAARLPRHSSLHTVHWLCSETVWVTTVKSCLWTSTCS